MRRQPLKEWTLLFYMSIGQGLEKERDGDLEDLQRVGSGEDVNVVVQCREPKTRKPADRYQLWNGYRESYESVPASRANLGELRTLIDFVRWADDHFPSRKTFLIMWGHGYGVHSIFDYDGRDGLMIPELAEALRQLKKKRNKKLDVLGFDACVMQAAEVAYELRDCVKYTVGSPVGTPANAWRYADLLKKVKEKPRSYPKTVAGMVLDCLKKSDELDDQTILSVLDFGKSGELFDRIAKLVESLDIAYESQKKKRAAALTLQKAAWVDCRQLPDLGDVCEKLKKDTARVKVKPTVKGNVTRYANRVLELLEPGGFVARRTALTDDRLRTKTGVSIFVPKIEVRGEGAAEINLNHFLSPETKKKEYHELQFTAAGWAKWAYSLPAIEEIVEDPCLWFRQTPCPLFRVTK